MSIYGMVFMSVCCQVRFQTLVAKSLAFHCCLFRTLDIKAVAFNIPHSGKQAVKLVVALVVVGT